MKTIQDVNKQQYHGKSESYLNSQVHAKGEEFEKIIQLIQDNPKSCILDLGCGGGHVSYTVAPVSAEVTAYDLSTDMLETVQKTAVNKKLKNIKIQQGLAETLPFASNTFDFVITRYSAHHWKNLGQALCEVFRTLKNDGIFVVIDTISVAVPFCDTFLQTIELIRDPSHVRNYTISEWTFCAEKAGFTLIKFEKQTLALNFQDWVQRMQTPVNNQQVIRQLQNSASDEIKYFLNIDVAGNFQNQVGYFVFKK